MKNYISIGGQKIELTEEQVEKISASLGASSVKLADVAVKDTFKIGEHEFVVLEHSGDTTAVILKDFLCDDQEFGENNNYNGSFVDGLCNEFADKMAECIGKDNLVEFTVDLTSDDGLKDYGTVKRKAALLTTEQYRRYVEILDEHNPEKWWWLATPWSTEKHGSTALVKCVAPSGYLDGMDKLIKWELGIEYYGRYMDDFYLIHSSKEYLKHCLEVIAAYLETLDLTLNGKTQIFPFKNGVNYLGFHTYITADGKLIRKLKNQNKRNAQKKFARMAKLVKEGKLPEEKFWNSYNAWKNHISHGNCYRLGNTMDEKIREILFGGKP